MSFPTDATVGETYTNAKGITYEFNAKGAWEVISTNFGNIRYTISATAPISPALTDQWWDTTQGVLKSWSSSGDLFFWTAIGGPNKNAPIVSDTEPQNVEVGAEWYYKNNVYVYLEIDGELQWVPVSSNNDVERAVPIAYGYAEEAFNFELFSNNYDYTWRNFGSIKVLQTTNGDDTVQVEDTKDIVADSDYVIVSSGDQALATISVLSVLNSTTIRTKTSLGFSLGPNDEATLSKTSFKLGTPGQATVQAGDILFSKPLTALSLRPGVVYIRRSANGVGEMKVDWRERGTLTWREAPFKDSVSVEGNVNVRDEIYTVDFTGIVELRVTYVANSGDTDVLYHMVLAVSKQNIENNRVQKPTNVSPADQAYDISATPTLTLSAYKSLYNIAQGGAEFRVAEDKSMSNLVFNSSSDFLAGWTATSGQTADFNAAVLYDNKNGIVVGDAGTIKKTTDAGKTFTNGATGLTEDLLDIAYNNTGRIFIVGTVGTLLYSDNFGTSVTPVTPPDSFVGTLSGVTAQANIILAVGAGGKIIRSTNNGTIFTSIAAANSYSGAFSAVAMNSTGAVVAVGASGEIQTSANYGVDWVKRNAPGGYSGTYYGVAINDSGVVLIVGDNGAIHKSVDYGATWTIKTPAASYTGSFRTVALSESYAAIGGTNGTVQTSSNFGDTWVSRPLAGATTLTVNSLVIDAINVLGLVNGEDGLTQTSIRLEGAVTSITIPAGTDLLSINHVYWWSGRYKDDVGFWSEWSTPTAFATQSNFSYISQPSNTAPANNATNITPTPTLQASAFSNFGDADAHATSKWQISASSTFTTLVYDSGWITDKTVHTVPEGNALTTAEDYYFRVSYKGTSGRTSPFSAATKFSVVAQPNTPTITYPAANAINISRSPTIQTSSYSITGGSPAHTSSQYQVASDIGFTTLVYDSNSVTDLLAHTLPANTLERGITYFARVRHRGDGTSWSAWSPVRQFTTISSAALPSISTFNNGKPSATVDTIGFDTAANSYVFNIDTTNFSSTGGDTLQSTTLQLATDVGFTNILVTVNLANKDQNSYVTLPASSYPSLIDNKTMYGRVRHTGSLSGPTDYGTSKTLAVEPPTGESLFTSPGNFTWECPRGVFSVAILAIGAGGNGFGRNGKGGGGLGYKNNVAVVPGQLYNVSVGSGGSYGTGLGSTSSFAAVLSAYGGERLSSDSLGGNGGGYTGGDGGGTGGRGGNQYLADGRLIMGGGGGAAGYTGDGGRGGYRNNLPTSGAGGGGGGGGYHDVPDSLTSSCAAGGGGVNVSGVVNNGVRGSNGTYNSVESQAGFGGSNGNNGNNGAATLGSSNGRGGNFGGGAGGNFNTDASVNGGNGAVRIIWGPDRSFPNKAA